MLKHEQAILPTGSHLYVQYSKIHYNPQQQLRYPLGHALYFTDNTVLMLLYLKILFIANPQYELQSVLEKQCALPMNPTPLQSSI